MFPPGESNGTRILGTKISWQRGIPRIRQSDFSNTEKRSALSDQRVRFPLWFISASGSTTQMIPRRLGGFGGKPFSPVLRVGSSPEPYAPIVRIIETGVQGSGMSEMSLQNAADLTRGDARVGRRAVIAASAGNALEWYDFTVYAPSSISRRIFPGADQTTELIKAFLAFGLGFVIHCTGCVHMFSIGRC